MGKFGKISMDFQWRTSSMEGASMPGIVEFPKVVQDALPYFSSVFSCQAQIRHFAEYLTGLFIAQRKTVLGIHDEFAHTTDQSCLNRFLTESPWDPNLLNDHRLELLQKDSSTQYTDHGVIALDNVLIDHSGKLIDDVGYFWDHKEQRSKLAHDYLFANYVCTNGKHFPLEFRRFKKEEQCLEDNEPFHNHTELFCQLVDWTCERHIPGNYAFDCFFTCADILNYIHSKKDPQEDRPRGYVGSLKFNRKVLWNGQEMRVDELTKTILPEDRKEIRRGDERQWYFTATLRIPRVDHRVRMVIIWDQRRDEAPRIILITNRTQWEVTRVLQAYRYRWTGTETYHRDGKQQLGMGDCQLRDGQGQTRHMYLVMLAYSLLVRELGPGRAEDWVRARLDTIGQACRAMLCESLRSTLRWAIDQVVVHGQEPAKVYAQLKLT